jgi:hypothetical protein
LWPSQFGDRRSLGRGSNSVVLVVSLDAIVVGGGNQSVLAKSSASRPETGRRCHHQPRLP